MKKSLKSLTGFFSSFNAALLILIIYAVLLASATFVEKYYGTMVARDMFYHSPLMIFVQVLLIIVFILYAGKYQYLRRKRTGLFLVHSAFIVILTGAMVTHLFSKEGILHVREGESSKVMLVRNGSEVKTVELPFSVTLNDFIMKRYPGSNSPSSYESMITVQSGDNVFDAHIYMNNVFDIKGYRLFQSSFDKDEKGSVLTVNFDSAGRMITYTGYIILFAGLVLSLVEPDGRFRLLYRRLKRLNNRALLVLLLPCMAFPSYAGSTDAVSIIERYRIDETHASKFGRLPVQSVNGRMMPINTYSSEILRKLHKSDKIGSLDSDQFLISLLIMPDVWMNIPLFELDNSELASLYGLSSPCCSYVEVFDSLENYKLSKDLETIYRKSPSERNGLEKDILRLDERINIFSQVANRKHLTLFPLSGDENHEWFSPGDDLSCFRGKDSMFVSRIFDWYLEEVAVAIKNNDWSGADKVIDMIDTYQQVKADGVDISHGKLETEVRYNKLNIFKYSRIGYLVLGGLTLVYALCGLLGVFRNRYVRLFLVAGVIAVFLFHTYGIGMRWYIGGYAPWSNSYETMVYVAWTMIMAGFVFLHRSMLVFSLATLFGGVVLFVSGLNWMDPQITTIVPVLKSPWLMFHVAVIVASYGFFGLGCLIGIVNLALMSFASRRKKNLQTRIQEFSIMNEMALLIGLVLMTAGTFLGAVWANESWGRYWGWDPKETWALITMVVYAIVTHIHLLRLDANVKEWLFNFLSVLAISSVLMTFFGVNYFLSGMHSYGHNDSISNLFVWICTAFVAVVIFGFLSYRLTKNINLKKTKS